MKNQIPKWAKPYLTKDQQQEIIDLIKQVESKTNGEILPVIANKSTEAPFLFYFNLSVAIIIVLIIDSLLYMYTQLPMDSYIYSLLAAPILAFILGKSEKWIRFVIPKVYQQKCVDEKAMLSFYHNITEQTQFQTGVLIYVSLLEHQVEILADKAIAEKVPPETWQIIVDKFIERIKAGEFFEGLKQSLLDAAEPLEEHFPKSEGNQNEIKNVVIFHQH